MTAHDTNAPTRVVCLEKFDESRVNTMVVHGTGYRLFHVHGNHTKLLEMLINTAVVAIGKRRPVFLLVFRGFVALVEFLGIIQLSVSKHFVWHVSQPIKESVYLL